MLPPAGDRHTVAVLRWLLAIIDDVRLRRPVASKGAEGLGFPHAVSHTYTHTPLNFCTLAQDVFMVDMGQSGRKTLLDVKLFLLVGLAPPPPTTTSCAPTRQHHKFLHLFLTRLQKECALLHVGATREPSAPKCFGGHGGVTS